MFSLVNGLQCYNCDKNALLTGADSCGDLSPSDGNTKRCGGGERFCMHISATPSTSALDTPTLKLGCAGELEALLGTFSSHQKYQNICNDTLEEQCHTVPDVPAQGFLPGLNNIEICCCTNNL